MFIAIYQDPKMIKNTLKGILDYFLYLRTLVSSDINNRSLILCYHCFKGHNRPGTFVDEEYCIDTNRFEQQMQMVSKYFECIPLEDILEAGTGEVKPKKGRIAVTFDDGYQSVKEMGLPILERYRIPATIFIATKFVEEPHYLPWWDLLSYIERNYHGVLDIDVRGQHYQFNLNSPGESREFKDKLGFFLRDAAINTLREVVAEEIELPRNGIMTIKEVKEIASLPLITIGVHTHSHVNVAKCTKEELRSELEENKTKLSAWSGQDVKLLAFPYGKWRHVGPCAAEIAQGVGFTAAFMTEPRYFDWGI